MLSFQSLKSPVIPLLLIGISGFTIGISIPSIDISDISVGILYLSIGICQQLIGIYNPLVVISLPSIGISGISIGILYPSIGIWQPLKQDRLICFAEIKKTDRSIWNDLFCIGLLFVRKAYAPSPNKICMMLTAAFVTEEPGPKIAATPAW